METNNIIISIAIAYILGSIPTAVWAGRLFHGIDVREHGSGNAGATNTIRVLGWKTGLPVLIIDILKGALAALLPVIITGGADQAGSSNIINYQLLAGLIAIVGHIFPLLAGFRGGKGVATTFGFMLAVAPYPTLICLGLFLLVLLSSGYVSLSSMSAGALFPILFITLFESPSQIFSVFSFFVAIALIATHHQNIVRLYRGEEKRFIRKR